MTQLAEHAGTAMTASAWPKGVTGLIYRADPTPGGAGTRSHIFRHT